MWIVRVRVCVCVWGGGGGGGGGLKSVEISAICVQYSIKETSSTTAEI